MAGVYADDSALLARAEQLSQQLQLPLVATAPETLLPGQLLLVLSARCLALCFTGRKQPGAVACDLVGGRANHRRHYGGGKGQMIARAVGIKGRFRPQVVDVTAGLGQDAFVLATLGCQVSLVERSPIVYQLLKDGLRRAADSDDQTLQQIVARMTCCQQQGQVYLQRLASRVDVVYLDPMFPEQNKSLQVKKPMQAFRHLLDGDRDAGELLAAALRSVRYRVVVKRPRKAPELALQFADAGLPAASYCLAGKASRYDIYSLCKLPDV
ncbi:MAG: class I SAM-dependent methyltransferase [Cellvibrionaceae bacterium]|nr:class I SAM-dependent methyltransferase [Cellvibrionaceae bacterium]